jgi:hypothetical protein
MLQAYEGYLEKGRFFPIGAPMNIQGRRRVIVTVLDEPAPESKETQQAKAWRDFFETVNASDEDIPRTFERVDGLQFVNWIE